MALNKRVDEITESDVDALIAEAVDERKVIEYKAGWDWAAPGCKDEFRRDVTSFANTSGGHLIYGVREVGGVPKDVVGLDITSPEEVRLRLSEILQAHVRPRVRGIEIGVVSPLANGKAAVVIRIPRSFARPHQVTRTSAPQDFQFWARNAAGKYRLDVDDLRAAFTLTEGLGERIRTFRLDRLASIIGDETPVPMREVAKVVVHLIPAGAFDLSARYDVSRAASPPHIWVRWGASFRYNFDGFVAYLGRPATSYMQVFRNGVLEGVSTALLNTEQAYIPSASLESELLGALPEMLSLQRAIGVEPPSLLHVSLLGVKGFRFAVAYGIAESVITQDVLPIPPEIVETADADPAQVMRPILDTIWNAAGFEKSR